MKCTQAITETTLKELTSEYGGLVQTGPFGTQLHKSDYIQGNSGVPVIMPVDMVEGKINTKSVAYISWEKADALSRHFLEEGDVVLARRGDIGRCAYVFPSNTGSFCGTGSIKISLPKGPLDSKYFYYLLQTQAVIGWLNGISVGATLKNLSAGAVGEMPLRFPNLEAQNKVCLTLDIFDELIENNTRRIEILEETARALYREWFVHYRYPGHENDTLVDSELGPIPEGWEVKPFREIVEVIKESKDPSAIPTGSPVLSLGDILNRSTVIRDWERPDAAGSRKYGFKTGDLLFAKLDPGSHKAAYAPITGFCSTDIIIFRPLRVNYSSFALSVISSDYFVALAAKTANGTTHIRVPIEVLLDHNIVLPTPKLLDELDFLAVAGMELCNKLIRENKLLIEVRDLLLPRLVSGELDVSDLDLGLVE
jgi:type I restriction enzyme, S subunit